MAQTNERLAGKRVWVMAKGFAPDEGGQQSYAQEIARAYHRLGAAVTVVTQTSAGPRDTTHGPLTVIDIGAGKGPSVPLRWLAALRRLEAADGRPDHCHAATWRTAIPPMLRGLRTAVSFHGREYMYARGATFSLLRAVAARARPAVVGSHYSTARLLERLPGLPRPPVTAWDGTTITPLPRSAPRTALQSTAGTPPVILTLCRLEPRKNLTGALRGAAIARARGVDFRYTIAGRGPDFAAVQALVATLGLGDVVTLAGFVPTADVPALYAAADIFLHPQLTIDHGRDFEGFGIAIADAMLAGCAAIIGREGASHELAEDGVSGLIVDGRSDAAIADAICRLASDAAARSAMAARGHDRIAAHMTWDSHIAAVLDAAGWA